LHNNVVENDPAVQVDYPVPSARQSVTCIMLNFICAAYYPPVAIESTRNINWWKSQLSSLTICC
ncbi:hypothetical protein, partial [Aeromonas hydrophila]|uniref:hypothetical protein n=1 Tax=Aeromonas hydrophila TaxID=644 RepID=UPI00225B2AFA